MRQHLPFRRVVLGLLGKIDAPAGHPGVEFVAQIWSQVRMDPLGRPGPASDFTRNRGPVTAQLGCDHRLGVARIEKFLNLDSVLDGYMPMTCKEGSATLLQVDV